MTQGGGKATTNPGLVSSQFLAGDFGLSAIPANQPGGTNYATGDARNAQSNVGVPNALQGAVPTVTQIGNYLAANNGRANPTALYLIGSGGNDISFALGNLPSAAQSPYVVTAANDLVAAIAHLAAAGARFIVVPDQPQSFGGAATEALRTTYDSALWGGLAASLGLIVRLQWVKVVWTTVGTTSAHGSYPMPTEARVGGFSGRRPQCN